MPVETIDRSAGELKAEAARVRADVDNFFARLLAPTGDGHIGQQAARPSGRRQCQALTAPDDLDLSKQPKD